MTAYRKDQGRLARMFAFWVLVGMAYYGAHSLNTELAARFPSMGNPIAGIVIPVLAVKVSSAFLIALATFAIGVYLLYRWQQQPKMVDLLVDTESELRKVTWPTGQEVFNSAMVVIVCVVFLMVYLAGVDWFLARVTRRLLLGGG